MEGFCRASHFFTLKCTVNVNYYYGFLVHFIIKSCETFLKIKLSLHNSEHDYDVLDSQKRFELLAKQLLMKI